MKARRDRENAFDLAHFLLLKTVPSTYLFGVMRDGNDSRSHASASERPSSPIFTIGVISVAVNLLFAAMLLRHHPMSRVGDSASVSGDAETAHAGSRDETRVAATPTGKDPLADFQWAQIESADLKEYINNLRAFGVPER